MPRFTPEEEQKIIDLWGQPSGPYDLVEILGRPYTQIKSKATALGARRHGKWEERSYRDPKPIPMGLCVGSPCPGNGRGLCGKRLLSEVARETEGYSTKLVDLVCVAGHRFPIPEQEEEKDAVA